MYGDYPKRIVLYRYAPKSGHRYRHIIVVESGPSQFQVHVREGDVHQPDLDFQRTEDTAAMSSHETLTDALADAESRRDKSVQEGWTILRED